jgi:predicted metal-binding protein
MEDRARLEAMFLREGFADFAWIEARAIVVARWVRMKCMFGCDAYGTQACCPPNVPPVDECRRFIREYSTAVAFHFVKRVENPEERRAWAAAIYDGLLRVEREVFLAGHEKVFMLPMSSCMICAECASAKEECRRPEQARPTPEALGVDVFSTVQTLGLPIRVLSGYDEAMNRYAFLLVE